jgi:YggT family protein
MIDVIVSFIDILSTVLVVAILIRALMTWIMPNDGTGFSRVLMDVTEPVLAPIRRVLPPVGGIDFSPILAMILIQLVGRLLASIIANSA